jgi:hypothetical protein
VQIGDVDVLGGVNGLDPAAGVEWIELAVNRSGQIELDLFGFNVRSGQQAFRLVNQANLETLNYDAKTGTMLAIGLDSTGGRTLNRLNSVSGTVTYVGPIAGYFIINSHISAFDAESRTIYAMLQPDSSTAPLHLVGINADSGAVKSSPIMCAIGAAGCPWSLEFVL